MPNANIIDALQEQKEKDYLDLLSSKARRNIRTEVLKNQELLEFEVKSKLTEEELALFYSLYLQVSDKNYDINVFPYPFKLFQTINGHKDWEFGILRIKENKRILGMVVCNKNGKSYIPMVIGIDYSLNEIYKTYKTILYKLVLHARDSEFKSLYFGFSADFEKKKLGATQITKFAFISSKDQFSFEIIESMALKK
jgi:hypothetical protein